MVSHLAVSKLTAGQAIDRDKFNELVDAVNRLEDAGNIKTNVYRTTTYSSDDDNIGVLAFNFALSGWNTGVTYESGKIISFSKYNNGMSFTAPPVVTVTPNGSGAFLIPYVTNINTSSFALGIGRWHPTTTSNLPGTVWFNVVAVGPIQNI